MATLSGPYRSFDPTVQRESARDVAGPVRDDVLEDLIHSWKRLGDPKLQRLAVVLVRTLEAEHRT